MVSICIRLPFLLNTDTSPAPDGARYLWPGLPDADAGIFWSPDSYPWQPEEAARFLDELRGMDARALADMRSGLSPGQIAANTAWREEMGNLSDLVAERHTLADTRMRRLLRERAQRILLWLRLQEELLLEIAAIDARCEQAQARLQDHFQENSPQMPETVVVQPDWSLLPHWRVCVVNACFFLEPEMPILAEGEMAADLLDRLDFQPAPEWFAGESAPRIVSARAPLWRALGQSRPDTELAGSAGAILRQIYGVERIWLARRD